MKELILGQWKEGDSRYFYWQKDRIYHFNHWKENEIHEVLGNYIHEHNPEHVNFYLHLIF